MLLLLLLVRMLSHAGIQRQVASAAAVVATLRTGRAAFRFGRRHLRRRRGIVGVESAAASDLLRRLHHFLVLAPPVLEPNFHLLGYKMDTR